MMGGKVKGDDWDYYFSGDKLQEALCERTLRVDVVPMTGTPYYENCQEGRLSVGQYQNGLQLYGQDGKSDICSIF